MRARQVAVASFKSRRRLLLFSTWILFCCCSPQLYQFVDATQGLSNDLPTTELYAPPRAQHSPVMDNLRRQMNRIHSSPMQRRPIKVGTTPPRASQANGSPSSKPLDASHVIIAPQLINKQSVANIKFKLSMIEEQIKNIYALLDGLTSSDEKAFKLSEVENVSSKLNPYSNMNPLQSYSPSSLNLDQQISQEMEQTIVQPLDPNEIVLNQESSESTPVVATAGSGSGIGRAGSQDPASINLVYNGGGAAAATAANQEDENFKPGNILGDQFVEGKQFSGSTPFQLDRSPTRLNGDLSENDSQSVPVPALPGLPPNVQPYPSSFSPPSQIPSEASQTQTEARFEPDQVHYIPRDTNFQNNIGSEGMENVGQGPVPINLPEPPQGNLWPQDGEPENRQRFLGPRDHFDEQDGLRRNIDRPIGVRSAIPGGRSVDTYDGTYHSEESDDNLSWFSDQEHDHELDQTDQQEDEEQEQQQQRSGKRKKRKKHSLRKAVIKGAKMAKDVANVSIHKARKYSPVVDAVARTVEEHVVPAVNEIIEDGKDVVHGVGKGIKKSRRRRKDKKKSRKLNRKVSVVVDDGAQTDMDLERAVPDMLGVYPNVPPEEQADDI